MTVVGFPPQPKNPTKKLDEIEFQAMPDLGKPYIDVNDPLDCRASSRQQMDQAALLRERELTHGDYATKCTIIMDIMRVIECYRGGLSDRQNVSLDMIIHKIGRILAGDPDFEDHWEDIRGYARLAIRNAGD